MGFNRRQIPYGRFLLISIIAAAILFTALINYTAPSGMLRSGIVKRSETLNNTEGTLKTYVKKTQFRSFKRLEATEVIELKVGTFNLWNFNGEWRERLTEISKIIRSQKLDIFALQEVRTLNNHKEDQITFFSKLLPEYNGIYQKATYIPGSEPQEEGIMIMSKYNITKHAVLVYSPLEGGSDQNTRVALRAVVNVPHFGPINFISTHISYADIVQCSQAIELLKFSQRGSIESPYVILAGDFNTYIDFEYPMDLLQGSPQAVDRCNPIFKAKGFTEEERNKTISFRDVWKILKPNRYGFTFISHTEGLDSCRPDRILVSNIPQIREKAVEILDNAYSEGLLSDHKFVATVLELEKL